jgi:flagellin-like hook-associated protein FlgL
MRANLLSLQQTGTQLDSTQLALATGNKVNSALDNPVNFFAAQALNQRASSLSALLDGMGQGIQTIQAANQGLTAVTGLVNQLTSIANSAKQDLANVSTQNVLATAGGAGLSSTIVNDIIGADISVGDTLSLTSGDGAYASFTATTAENLSTLVSQINQTSTFSATVVYGNGVETSPNGGAVMAVGSAYLEITAADGSSVTAANVAGNTGTSFLTGLGLTGGASSAVVTGSATADNTNYQAVLTQINALVANSSYQGNNLINGTGNNLTVQTNENSTSPITVDSVDATTASTGLALAGTAVTSAATIATATTAINAALAKLQTDAAGFANSLSMVQNRQDFTTNLVNTLQDGASSLTIADKNEEGANLLALQTQQQLGIEALSLSSQANQSVLRLFS